MSNLVYVFRYFRVVPPIPPMMIGSFLVLTVIGALATLLTSQETSPLVPVLVLQAFSASTGFAGPARRGYFDLLMVRGATRVRIAAAQWITAITPGLCSWLTLVAVTVVAKGMAKSASLSSGTMTAFLMASTIPWAVTVPLPRFSGAIGWLLMICLSNVGGVIWPDSVHDVVFPIDLVGQDVAGRPDVLLPAVLLSVLTLVAALRWVHRADIPLESAQ